MQSKSEIRSSTQPGSTPILPNLWIVLDLEARKKGSLEQGVLALAQALTSEANVTIVFACEPAEWLADGLSQCHASVKVLDFRRAGRAAATFARWMMSERPDLVHFHFVRAYSPLVIAARAAGAAVVLHDHITLGAPCVPMPPRPPLVRAVIRAGKRVRAALLNRLVHRRIAVSAFVADSVRDSEFVRDEELVINENGIDVSRFVDADARRVRAEWAIPAGAPMIVCPSRMAPEKGVDVLIRAFALLRTDAHLVIVGNGADQEKCERLARALELSDRIHFVGLRNDIECVFAAADAVAVPSLWDEAFGLVVVEAMAAGAPVVVTESGAMPEIVENGTCGLVVPKGDEKALASALSRLIDDRETAERIRTAARKRVMRMYQLGNWVERNLHIYRGVLSHRASKRPSRRRDLPTSASSRQ